MERISTTLSGREAKTNRKSGDYVDFRSYRHIFTDANQSSPADDIKLGFQSRYREEQFEPGEYTYFHFPLVQRDFKYADTDVRATSGISIPSNFTSLAYWPQGPIWSPNRRTRPGIFGCGWMKRSIISRTV